MQPDNELLLLGFASPFGWLSGCCDSHLISGNGLTLAWKEQLLDCKADIMALRSGNTSLLELCASADSCMAATVKLMDPAPA